MAFGTTDNHASTQIVDPSFVTSHKMDSSPEPFVTSTVLFKIKAGDEAAFENGLRDFFHRSRAIPGCVNVYVIRPVPGSGSREYGLMRSFVTEADRDRFYSSDVFKQWEAEFSRFTEGDARRDNLTGLEAWFTLPGAKSIVPPPKWKMALSAFFGTYIVGVFLYLVLKPATNRLPALLELFINGAAGTALLTWAVMPHITRLLGRWLYAYEREAELTDSGLKVRE